MAKEIAAAFDVFHERFEAAGSEGREPEDVLALLGIDWDELLEVMQEQVPIALQEEASFWRLVEAAMIGSFVAGAIWEQNRGSR